MALALTTKHLLLVEVAAWVLSLKLLMQVCFGVGHDWAVGCLIQVTTYTGSVVRCLRPTNCSINERVVNQVDSHVGMLGRLRMVHLMRHAGLFTTYNTTRLARGAKFNWLR